MTEDIFTLKGTVEKSQAALVDNNISYWFDIIEDESLTFQSQITDNYIENNTAIQDHIAQSPLVITLSGYLGEAVYTPPKKFLESIKNKVNDFSADKFGITISDKLGPITSLLPSVDNVTQIARNSVQYVESSFNRYKKIYEQIRSLSKKEQKLPTESAQQYTARKLKDLWLNRKMVEVISPWGYYDNMQIQSINLRQGDTRTLTNLSVTLKQINYASTQTTQPDLDVMAKYNAMQRTQEANHGKAQGVEVNNSILYQHFGKDAPYNIYEKPK